VLQHATFNKRTKYLEAYQSRLNMSATRPIQNMQLQSARAIGQRVTGQARCAVTSTGTSHGAAVVEWWGRAI
jgi:hypothetical protein